MNTLKTHTNSTSKSLYYLERTVHQCVPKVQSRRKLPAKRHNYSVYPSLFFVFSSAVRIILHTPVWSLKLFPLVRGSSDSKNSNKILALVEKKNQKDTSGGKQRSWRQINWSALLSFPLPSPRFRQSEPMCLCASVRACAPETARGAPCTYARSDGL